MFPNSRQKKITRTILFFLVIAMLAHLCSVQLAHGAEKFMRSESNGMSVEMRGEATVVGQEIRFRQVARWADADKTALDPVGDLVLVRFAPGEGFRSISVPEIRTLLGGAGVNVATINFSGSLICTVTRSDAQLKPGEALKQLDESAPPPPAPLAFETQKSDVRTLRDVLTQDIADRLHLPADSLQITFRGQDEKSLRLSEPQFRFGVDAPRSPGLGDVSWSVTITSESGSSRVFVGAFVRAWQEQVVVLRPLSTKQVITESDVEQRRVLADRKSDDLLLKREQVVGQMASRDLRAGTVVTSKMVDAVQLVRTGQYVTIEQGTGAVRVRTVAKALDSGTMGQTVRVRDEANREIYRVTITGAQQATLGGV